MCNYWLILTEMKTENFLEINFANHPREPSARSVTHKGHVDPYPKDRDEHCPATRARSNGSHGIVGHVRINTVINNKKLNKYCLVHTSTYQWNPSLSSFITGLLWHCERADCIIVTTINGAGDKKTLECVTANTNTQSMTYLKIVPYMPTIVPVFGAQLWTDVKWSSGDSAVTRGSDLWSAVTPQYPHLPLLYSCASTADVG